MEERPLDRPEDVREESHWKRNLLVGAGSVAVIGAGIWAVSKYFTNKHEEQAQNASTVDGHPASYAKQIIMAFDNDGWWGTNVPLVRKTLQEIPTYEVYEQVQREYEKLKENKGNLNRDLQDELTATEYREMDAIIKSKPKKQGEQTQPDLLYKKWASRLKDAFDYTVGFFPATDEDAVNAVFNEIPTRSAFDRTAAAYQKEYGQPLGDALLGEFMPWEVADLLKIIKGKPA